MLYLYEALEVRVAARFAGSYRAGEHGIALRGPRERFGWRHGVGSSSGQQQLAAGSRNQAAAEGCSSGQQQLAVTDGRRGMVAAAMARSSWQQGNGGTSN